MKPWSEGGETRLANLCSLCRTHHRYVHELGFRVEARGDGDFAFFNRGGFEIPPVPAAPAIPRNAVVALQVVNRSAGIEIDGRTNFPRWDGTPPDYDHIVCLLANKYPPAS